MTDLAMALFFSARLALIVATALGAVILLADGERTFAAICAVASAALAVEADAIYVASRN